MKNAIKVIKSSLQEIGFHKAFAEMDNEFTSSQFISASKKHGVSDYVIKLDRPREFLRFYANQKNGMRYSKTYVKKSAKELAELEGNNILAPKTPNFPPVYPQTLPAELPSPINSYSDKELAEELKRRGFKVMIQEITYKEL